MSATLSLAIKPVRDELDRIAEAIEDLASQDDWPEDLTFRVHLVLEELILNIMDYGAHEGDLDITLDVESEDNSIEIAIRDRGKAFDPTTEAPEPDLDASVEERKVGGLGVYLTKTLMDEVTYSRVDDRNHLHITTRKVR